ncbi:MAG: DUF7669 domain-containing protein [Motilibacteraceae bacterium]
MTPQEWVQVWSTTAARMAAHRAAGRTHLLTEDVLRFEAVQALGECGVPAGRLAIEVSDRSLLRGKLDLVLDPPAGTVVEFKFPRDSVTSSSADTMTLGEMLRDFFRVAGTDAQDRWVVQLVNERLGGYLRSAHARAGLGWVDSADARLELSPAAVQALPQTARTAVGPVALAGGVSATCMLAEPVGDKLVLLAYQVDPLLPEPATGNGDTFPPAEPDPPAGRAAVQQAAVGVAAAVPAVGGDAASGGSGEVGTRDGARREILAAARALTARTGRPEFTVLEVVEEMRRRGTGYAPTTIRTMMTAHLRANADGAGTAGYSDLARVGRGTYRLTAPLGPDLDPRA